MHHHVSLRNSSKVRRAGFTVSVCKMSSHRAVTLFPEDTDFFYDWVICDLGKSMGRNSFSIASPEFSIPLFPWKFQIYIQGGTQGCGGFGVHCGEICEESDEELDDKPVCVGCGRPFKEVVLSADEEVKTGIKSVYGVCVHVVNHADKPVIPDDISLVGSLEAIETCEGGEERIQWGRICDIFAPDDPKDSDPIPVDIMGLTWYFQSDKHSWLIEKKDQGSNLTKVIGPEFYTTYKKPKLTLKFKFSLPSAMVTLVGEHPKAIERKKSSFEYLLGDPALSDVKIKCGDTTFFCHRVLLAHKYGLLFVK